MFTFSQLFQFYGEQVVQQVVQQPPSSRNSVQQGNTNLLITSRAKIPHIFRELIKNLKPRVVVRVGIEKFQTLNNRRRFSTGARSLKPGNRFHFLFRVTSREEEKKLSETPFLQFMRSFEEFGRLYLIGSGDFLIRAQK